MDKRERPPYLRLVQSPERATSENEPGSEKLRIMEDLYTRLRHQENRFGKTMTACTSLGHEQLQEVASAFGDAQNALAEASRMVRHGRGISDTEWRQYLEERHGLGEWY